MCTVFIFVLSSALRLGLAGDNDLSVAGSLDLDLEVLNYKYWAFTVRPKIALQNESNVCYHAKEGMATAGATERFYFIVMRTTLRIMMQGSRTELGLERSCAQHPSYKGKKNESAFVRRGKLWRAFRDHEGFLVPVSPIGKQFATSQ